MVPSEVGVLNQRVLPTLDAGTIPARFLWYSRKHNAYHLVLLVRVEANVVVFVSSRDARTFLRPPKPQPHSSFYL